MSHETQIDVVRLSLSILLEKARISSMNIANKGVLGSREFRIDVSKADNALRKIAEATTHVERQRLFAVAERALVDAEVVSSSTDIELDDQIARMVTIGTDFQALTDALSRKFALMRLSISGRS